MARTGEREGDKGAKESPTGIKGPPFVPVGAIGPLIPFPLPPPEPFSSLVLAVLGSGEGSSCSFLHHICEDL